RVTLLKPVGIVCTVSGLCDICIENDHTYVDNIKVDYHIGGVGLPPIVFVHRLDSQPAPSAGILAHLAQLDKYSP
ncbi:MAG: hypothetical protein QW514_02395, partial [Thermoprotei archaeon]